MNALFETPIIPMVLLFMIPIVAILTKHQQKMALLMRQESSNDDNLAIRAEIQRLSNAVNSLTLTVEDLKTQTKRNEAADALQERF